MIITVKILQRWSIAAMAIWPLILVAKPGYRDRPVLINHERIHLRQQTETLLIGFILLYFGQYVILRTKGSTHDQAYRGLAMEREAKENERNLNYLRKRIFFAFLSYF
jgi:hypothetical protein